MTAGSCMDRFQNGGNCAYTGTDAEKREKETTSLALVARRIFLESSMVYGTNRAYSEHPHGGPTPVTSLLGTFSLGAMAIPVHWLLANESFWTAKETDRVMLTNLRPSDSCVGLA